MARVTCTMSIKLPWWYSARIATLAALAAAGFDLDMRAEGEAIAKASTIRLR